MIRRHARFTIILLVVALAAVGGFAAVRINTASAAAGAETPTLVIEPSHLVNVKAKPATLMVLGAGFQPNQEIRLVISQADGSLSDIGSVTTPETIKADAFGVWGAQVRLSTADYLNASIAAAGKVSTVRACDANYNVLVTTAIGFYDPGAPYPNWPAFARAIVAKPKASITVAPTSVEQGRTVTVSGANFVANEKITITIDNITLGTATADKDERFTAKDLAVSKDVKVGKVTVTATGDKNSTATTTLEVKEPATK